MATIETINILFTGDLYPAANGALCLDGNPNPTTEYMRAITSLCDYNVVNLEAPLCHKEKDYHPIPKTGPNIYGNQNVTKGIKAMGFNVASVANNHIMDMGEEALLDTLDACASNGIQTYGAGCNLNQARKPLLIEKNNIKIALLAFSENEFGNTSGEQPGANPLNTTNNFRDIRDAKKNADKVIVSLHGGIEMYSLPAPYIKDLCRFYVESGADAVIVHHPHCFSGYELFNGAPIFYSLGNLLFDSVYPLSNEHAKLWDKGYCVKLNVSKTTINFEILPHIQFPTYKGIKPMSDTQNEEFENQINKFNEIIKDDQLLELEFTKHVETKKYYADFFEKYPQPFIRFVKRNILPSSLKGKNLLLLINLIRCEAHRDVTIRTLLNLSKHENHIHN